MDNLNECQLQIRLITTQDIYAVPDVPLSVPTNIESKGLNQLLNQLLLENNPDILKTKEFDFLVVNELLRVPLLEHLQDRNVSTEATVEIEYIERIPAPEPQESILHDDWVSSISSTNKWILTGCYDHSVSIYTNHGKSVVSTIKHGDIIKDVAWIDKEDVSKGLISVSHDQTAIIWSWTEGTKNLTPKIQLKGHERGIECVGVGPNGLVATGSWDTQLKVWSSSFDPTDTGEPDIKRPRLNRDDLSPRTAKVSIKAHKEAVSSVIWLDENIICTAGMDHVIRLWHWESNGLVSEFVDQKAFLSASYSPLSKTLLASCTDKNIRLYDPRSTEGTICKSVFTSHSQWVSDVTWSKYNEHLFLSGAYDATVKMWDTRSPKAPLFNLQGHEGQVLAVDWSNDKYLVSGGADNMVHIFKNKHVTK
ncbi:unnamed protein product [Ceutorhynchus assimilis]|uniref:Ribosome biogenesis protein WDR12 homolog n=1 Tax=Ceutorhynchus assimilis TaxID=467358 RepID=A0A9N9MQX3_9CUCU|nr:unnamed protein product [Ceutorhynchus assimilis]